MEINISIDRVRITRLVELFVNLRKLPLVIAISILLSIYATAYTYLNDVIVAYGDAESHLNIAKRVIHGLTPGFAQLGGIWLPLPHMLMIPFVYFDSLWRTGLAGSIVSGLSFIVTSVMLYKIGYLLTKNSAVSFLAYLVFALNPNILYLQSTPMTELPLLMFFTLSTYFFLRYIKNTEDLSALLLAAFFGFCAVLSRYDGWFLVLFEAVTIILVHIQRKDKWQTMEGKFILYSTLAFFGIAIWMMWDLIILGDPFYFTNSQFSAKAQQQEWLRRGELPAYHNLPLALAYYIVTSMSNAGVMVFIVGIIGFILFLRDVRIQHRYLVSFILFVPFIFNVFTLFVGQSVIFIPHLTPVSFEWRLFNVRYGVLFIPVLAFFFAFAFQKATKVSAKMLLIFLLLFQFVLYGIGYSKVITLADGKEGLSKADRPDAEYWIKANYDYGFVLIDDYARTMSIIRSGVPMRNIIYIGNKPFWQESLQKPEKYARWIVMQKDDAVWKAIYDKIDIQGRLYKYFEKAYTSPQILIFRRKY